MIREGQIGRIISFRTTFGHGGPETWSITPGKDVWFFDRKKAAMGAMADLGVHKTDLIGFLTGGRKGYSYNSPSGYAGQNICGRVAHRR